MFDSSYTVFVGSVDTVDTEGDVMKVRMFNDRLVPLTEQVNMWLSTLGPKVVIEHVLQSEAPGRNEDETWAVTLTFLYSEKQPEGAVNVTERDIAAWLDRLARGRAVPDLENIISLIRSGDWRFHK